MLVDFHVCLQTQILYLLLTLVSGLETFKTVYFSWERVMYIMHTCATV